jgi:hypothetical protein
MFFRVTPKAPIRCRKARKALGVSYLSEPRFACGFFFPACDAMFPSHQRNTRDEPTLAFDLDTCFILSVSLFLFLSTVCLSGLLCPTSSSVASLGLLGIDVCQLRFNQFSLVLYQFFTLFQILGTLNCPAVFHSAVLSTKVEVFFDIRYQARGGVDRLRNDTG